MTRAMSSTEQQQWGEQRVSAVWLMLLLAPCPAQCAGQMRDEVLCAVFAVQSPEAVVAVCLPFQ